MQVAALDFGVGLAPGHNEGAGLGQQLAKNVDFVDLAIADVDEDGTTAVQIQKRVQHDGRFGHPSSVWSRG